MPQGAVLSPILFYIKAFGMLDFIDDELLCGMFLNFNCVISLVECSIKYIFILNNKSTFTQVEN